MSEEPEQQGKLTYPCEIDVKIFARAGGQLEQKVRQHVVQSIDQHRILGIRIRPSNNGNYHSVSCKIHAINAVELDNLYRDLSKDPDIIMVL